MTQNYSRPRNRLRSFGVGILTGDAASGGDLMADIQENLQFRLESARSMLMGGGMTESMSPLERRRELMERRRGLLQDDNSDSGSSSRGGMSRGSGRISNSGKSSSGNDTTNVNSDTPSMSEVNTGTKKRANERGFGN